MILCLDFRQMFYLNMYNKKLIIYQIINILKIIAI